jgi:hypothetical protein
LAVLTIVGLIAAYPSKRTKGVTVRVTPSDLFTGDLERIEPDLGLTSSAYFTVEADAEVPAPSLQERLQAMLEGDFFGPRPRCPVLVEEICDLWKKGERTEGLRSIPGGASWRSPFSLSLKEELDQKGNHVYRLITARSGSSNTSRWPVPTLKDGSDSPSKIDGPIVLPIDEPVAVWAYIKK